MTRISLFSALLLVTMVSLAGCASDGASQRPQVLGSPSGQATAASAQTIAPITSYISNTR